MEHKQTVEEAKPKFGDYILVEQHRYGGANEFYEHKVINTMRSNVWMDVPAITHLGMQRHGTMEDVVSCICCGVVEETVIKYRIGDVKIIKKETAPLPTNSMPGWISVEQRLPTKDDTCDEYYNEVLTIQVGRKRPTFMKFWEIQHCPFTKWWMKITPPESAPTEPKQ